ncbi:hypothetical protein HY989_03010 [Candidatus Micrarchaeota archaeon]|nr:hypothetical protein [Candidatus Micrarchaeota archaeon]
MRGVFGFVFLLGFIALFSTMLVIYQNSQEKIEVQKRGMILLERVGSDEMDLKNSFSQMLECYSAEMDEKFCALEILRWEKNLGDKFKAPGISLNLWFGSAKGYELQGKSGKTPNPQQFGICTHCHKLGEITIDFSKKPNFLLNSIVYSDEGNSRISKRAISKSPAALAEFSGMDIFLGGFAHYEKYEISAVFLIPEGFS